MNAFALHHAANDREALRWSSCAIAIAALHAGLIAAALAWYHQPPQPGVSLPAIMVDMSPVSASPEASQLDLAPGPLMQQADASPPDEAKAEPVQEEMIPPTPVQENPIVAAPPEQKVQPKPEPPKPVKAEAKPKPAPVKPKVVRAEAKKPSDAPPAPRTSAPQRAERIAPSASNASPGASAAAVATYNRLVAAHLQRFKQYPPQAKSAGQQGVARLSFTLGRGGQVLSSRLGGSSGHAALDAETMAMVRRAQPFPPFPTEMKQASVSFSVPVSFSIR